MSYRERLIILLRRPWACACARRSRKGGSRQAASSRRCGAAEPRSAKVSSCMAEKRSIPAVAPAGLPVVAAFSRAPPTAINRLQQCAPQRVCPPPQNARSNSSRSAYISAVQPSNQELTCPHCQECTWAQALKLLSLAMSLPHAPDPCDMSARGLARAVPIASRHTREARGL